MVRDDELGDACPKIERERELTLSAYHYETPQPPQPSAISVLQ
jgi:hypothetical protein